MNHFCFRSALILVFLLLQVLWCFVQALLLPDVLILVFITLYLVNCQAFIEVDYTVTLC